MAVTRLACSSMAEPTLEYRVSEEIEGGVYANSVTLWHTGHEFTFDFCSSLPTRQDEDGSMTVPLRVVSRIKLPVSVIFDLLQAINTDMTKYEAAYGPISGIEPIA